MTPDLSDFDEPQDSAPENETLDDLEALMSESLAQAQETAEAKAARERVRRGGQSPKEKAEDDARLRAWELRHEWEPAANVAVIEYRTCACGAHAAIFSQLMQRQVHRTMRASSRWQTVTSRSPSLPNEVIRKQVAVPLCLECLPKAGFDPAATPAAEWQA